MRAAAFLIGAALFVSESAFAHGGAPTVAWVNEPIGLGTIADQSFTFSWVDFDQAIATGTATVDLFYVRTRPPTFSAGRIPEPLDGTPIVLGILEKDRANTWTWDTSAVPAGSYMIWSRVNEPPSEIISPLIISYSPGVLTVQHAGDPIHPSVMITAPDTAFRYADASFAITYAAFDPDGTGRVKIEAGTSFDGTGFTTIADDLPATATGSFTWDTTSQVEGDWTLRATITDARGLSYEHYGRYFLLVTHLGPRPDSGVSPGTDGGGVPEFDGGDMVFPEPPPGGCGCNATHARATELWPLFALLLFVRRRR